ncbi:MAG: DUF11 domain-containing protein, partial [Gemmatimonadetes bacterium]|nr:DUF11 domain-containing protein [Gemmatimonadota bacterium]
LPIEQADLTLAKTVNSASPSEGDTVRWQIVLTNDGPDVATSTEVSDLLPAGVTFAGATASIGSYAPATGLWTIGNLNVAAPETLVVDATVDAGTAGETITNSASASADQPDPGGASDTAQITVRAADLALVKAVDDPAPSEGGAIVYTIDVWNAGPDSATGVAVVDSLPIGIQYASSIASQGSYDSGSGVWSVGVLAPADTASLAISATLGAGTAGSTIRNVARIGASSEGDPVAANDTAFVDVSVVGADLAIATSVDNANPTELDTIRYTIEATNAGPDSTSGVVIDVAPPAGFLPRGDNASQGTWNGGQDEWTIGSLGAGATATLELDLEVPSGSGGGQFWLSAGVQTSALADPDPANDADSVSVSVVDATGVTVLGSQPTASARPGQTEVVLGTFTLQNTGIPSLTLTGATFANTTTGPGTQGQEDAELGTVQLRRDNGNGLYEPSLDLLAGTATVSAGQIVFTGLSVNVPNDGTRILHVVSSAVPLTARDGDALDLRLEAPASLTFNQGVTTINSWPVEPAGAVTIDGMVAAQIPVTTYASTNVERGQTNAGALAFRLPANGYQSDTLTEARFQNLGTAVAGTDVIAAKLWQDGGDGSFDHGAGDDTLISVLTNVGGIWTATGLSVAVPVNGLPAWVSVDVAPAATLGATIRLAVKGPGPDGLLMTSGNSGPLDTASAASRTLTVTNSVSNLTAWVVDQSNATMIPGVAPRTVFRFEIANESAAAETLSTVRFTNTTVGAVGATQAQLDADWQPLDLQRERVADAGGSGGLPPAGVAGTFSGGLATFTVDEVIAPGDTAVFVVTSGASVAARDSDRLDLVIASTTDLSFRRAVNVSGSFPLDGAATLRVDGMSSAQLVFGSVDPSILTGATRAQALDVTVPANGYVDDTLLRFDVTNLGNAAAGDDIERVELWSDDGDGLFDPVTDSALGEMLYTGNRWERTGLSLPAPAGVGRRLFVSVDISELATAGRTVRLAVPGPPDFGVGMASDNDGPVDASASGSAQTISTVDRVTVSPLAGTVSQVRPGRTNVLLLGFALENHYLTSKTLSGLVVTNRTSGVGSQAELDAEVAQLSIWVDNGDGVFKGAPEDTLRGTAFFEDGAAEFTGVNCTIAAGGTRRVFVSADVSLNAAADGDSLAAWIDGPAEMTFLLPTALAASFPIDTGAKAIVDGMVAGQFSRFPAPAATLGAGEGPSLVLDVRVPSNGYRSDVLNRLELVNLGNATSTDLADVRLWRDGGDGAFDAGGVDDIDLGGLALFGGRWVHPSLTESLPWPGARMFVSVTSSATPTDSATVRFAIPVNGIEVASGNDGPLDAQVANNETTLLSTAVLLSELEITPSATTVDSLVTVTMNVRNLHATATMDSVAPSALTSLPAAGLQYESGPSPAFASIAPGGDATFTWTYRASFIGESRLRGLASGAEAGSGIPHQSLTVTSNAVQVYVSSQSLDLYAVSSMPFSINRGQQGVVPLTLTFENPAGPNGTDVELGALRIRLEDDQGNGVVPSDLLSRVVVSEGGSTYLDKTAIETSGSEVDLTLATPITIQSAGAGSQATVGLALDISDSTAVPFFVVKILDASWFTANDATTGAPVSVDLQEPPVYPVSSGLARVVAEATRLDVAAVAAPDFPAGRGQSAITVLDVTLNNPDPAGLAADVRVPSFAIALRDSAGMPIPDPQNRIDRIRVRTPNQVHLDRSINGSDGTTLGLSLTTLISVPVNTNLPMMVEFDLAADATLGAFRVELADTSSFEARDANTGAPLPVTYTPDPLAGPLVSVQAAADSMRASGVALMPATIPVGTPNVTAMRISVEHPGGSEVGPIVIDHLTLGCRDDANQPVVPALYLDRVAVRRGGVEVGVVTAPPVAGGEVVVPLNGVSLAPGERDTLEVRFDAEVTAPATLFALTVSATGIGAMDGNLMLPVTVAPEAGSEFPLSSGFAQLSTPARTLVAAFAQSMPAALAADGGDVDAATLTLRNPADPSSGSISIDHLNLRARDRDGNLLAIGSVVERVVSLVDGELCADSGTLLETDEQATMPCVTPILLDPQDARDVVMRLTLRAGAFADGLRIGLLADDIGVVQPGNPLLSVAVVAEDGQSFPFWTLAGNFGGTNLADSYSNFPNPFAAGRQNTTLAFYLQEPATVTLTLYTLRGQTVRTILAGVPLGAGLHQDATWDGRNGRGDTVANGTYLARIQVSYESGGSDEIVRKVAVVR